jgi:hypothetical protein
MRAVTRRALERAWAATGALTVALFACGLLFGDLLGTDNYPALDAPAAEVRAYFAQNATEVRALGFFHLLSALALTAFSVRLGALAGGLATAGGVVAAAFLALSALCYRVLAEPAVLVDAGLAHALVVLSYLAGGPAITVFLTLPIGAVSVRSLREGGLPRWCGRLGVAALVVSAASALWLLGPMDNRSALYGVLLLAAVLGFGWLVAVSVVLARRA